MMSHQMEQGNNPTRNSSVEDEARIWHTFADPGSDDEFCQAWLALLCLRLKISAGIVLTQSAETNSYSPIAAWPRVSIDLSRLGPIAERALADTRGVIHRSGTAPEAPTQVAYPIEVFNRVVGAVVLEDFGRSDAQANDLLRQLHWAIAWLSNMFQRRELLKAKLNVERIGSAMEILTTALDQNRLQQSLFDVSNQITRYLRCSRVAIGLIRHDSVRIAALSNAAWFEKNTTALKLYASAMEEAYDQLAIINYVCGTEEDNAVGTGLVTAHGRLARETGAQALLSVPLKLGAQCLGVITFERDIKEPFNDDECSWAETLASLFAPAIEQKRLSERNHLIHILDDARSLLRKLFGPRHLIWKFSAATIVAVVALLTLATTDYRVAANTVIEGEIQQASVAPFDGYVAASYVRAGDRVQRGQALYSLDDRDLRLELHRWTSEREQYSRKLREAMAHADLSTIQILSAQIQQAEAQLALANERITRAKVSAPFDGIVISGDLSQLTGSPVERGKKLFEIAPLQAYRVILQVDEREIRHIQTGQRGKLLISGITGDPIPFHISKITPVATAQDGRNFFRVEASLQQGTTRLRPGMEGIGKIHVGEERLGWIITHGFVDWLRISLWSWVP